MDFHHKTPAYDFFVSQFITLFFFGKYFFSYGNSSEAM
ncbi:putative membrane protein [Bacteroides fragilis str. 3986T(B)10]|uniref:Putative membrane protein n=1 Tax=Bacteroides fragilis str. S36L11 TaxID=1339327 RepID=A0A016AK91_BACFG|nr:putative membrane protein [Bacteroides fragilis str. 3986T(B)10]EXZ28796.1 putative membrane protein [Bacteroides fragilis str. S36L11]